jgi:16S rRNA (guanine966-N2)-methyltransferase
MRLWRIWAQGAEVMRIVGGRLSGRRFGAPTGRGTRPTSERVREALGSALEARDAYADAQVLDLFAGTGALSFEALSRGAKHSVLVDQDVRAIREINTSAKDLGLAGKLRPIRLDLLADPSRVIGKLPATASSFTLLFADAPYSETNSVPALLAALTASGRLALGALLVVEHSATHDWRWPKGLAPEADYRYGQTRISLGVYAPEKGPQ